MAFGRLLDEPIFVVAGMGAQMLNDEDPAAIGPGDCIYIPKGVYHATQHTGWKAMKRIMVYAPAGPEDVFRGMDDCTIVPPGHTPA